MKTYNVKMNIGKSKYVVCYCDDVKTHPDGSPFFDIRIFKNLKNLNSFLKVLKSENYQQIN